MYFRELYNLAPTDPRFLEADEETILRDLLVRHIAEERRDAALDPGGAYADKLAEDEEAQEGMLQSARDFVEDPGTMERLSKIVRGLQPAKRVVVRLGRPKIRMGNVE